MTKERIRGYCPRCRHDQIFEKNQIHHGVHLFLTIVTLGLWSVSWISSYLGNRLRPWRCPQCGWSRPQASSRPSTAVAESEPVKN